MEQSFQTSRFLKLLKRQWLDLGKVYLSTLLIIVGILLFCYSIAYYSFMTNDYNIQNRIFSTNFRYPLFIVTSIIFLSLIGNHYFSHFGNKGRAIIDLMLPASRLEKFLASLFYTVFFGIAGLLLIYYIIDWAFILKMRSWYESMKFVPIDGEPVKNVNLVFPFMLDVFIPYAFPFVLAVGGLIVSLYHFGSLAFGRFAFIKITLSVTVLIGIIGFIWVKFAQMFFNGRIPIEEKQLRIQWDLEPLQVFTWVICLIIGFIWMLCYLKFKEKEV
ncbi:MAG: hypothetical protein EOO99_05865 [Pedobacter sp.]|nr:MAG: hypothetical protein EOO99_05865 [Pedobacter sp.]